MKKDVIAVFTDIHGHQEEHECLISKIKERFDIVQYIYLGDLIDRGGESKGVLDYIKILIDSGAPVTLIKGNHENEMLTWFNTNDETLLKSWLKNGGKETMKSLTGRKYAPYLLRDVIKEYMPVFDSMRHYHVQKIAERTFVFSHSGGDIGTLDKILNKMELAHDDFEDLMYSRQRYLHGGVGRNNTFYVYGHTPVHYASDRDGLEPLILWDNYVISADICLDTGCYTGRALSALIIDSETGEFETVSLLAKTSAHEGTEVVGGNNENE